MLLQVASGEGAELVGDVGGRVVDRGRGCRQHQAVAQPQLGSQPLLQLGQSPQRMVDANLDESTRPRLLEHPRNVRAGDANPAGDLLLRQILEIVQLSDVGQRQEITSLHVVRPRAVLAHAHTPPRPIRTRFAPRSQGLRTTRPGGYLCAGISAAALA
jgi:hypothetical protein